MPRAPAAVMQNRLAIMYNVVEKLRRDEALTPRERAIHEIAACGIVRDMHDARVKEESRGVIR